jgi:hypothetical protein
MGLAGGMVCQDGMAGCYVRMGWLDVMSGWDGDGDGMGSQDEMAGGMAGGMVVVSLTAMVMIVRRENIDQTS